MSEIDWNRELRRIEREFDGLPPEPPSSVKRTRQALEQLEKEQREQRFATFGTLARLALVIALAVGLYWWPYPRECGSSLLSFLGAELALLIGSVWVTATTWRHRLARLHALSIVMVVASLALLALEIAPRNGWVTRADGRAASWACPGTQWVPLWR
jgi:hypothetical protein